MVSEAKQVKAYVKHKIVRLSGSNNESAVRSTLAKLRRGIGKAPGSIPDIWSITLEGLPETQYRRSDGPTYSEWAAHTALTLYALHQQGKDLKQQCMNKEGESLGTALRKLVNSEEDENRVKRRFDAAATSDSLKEFSYHLRGLIQLLKAKDIPLDYSTLAEDLYRFQFPEVRDSIRLGWGRDYYRRRHTEENGNKNIDNGKDEKDGN